MEQLPEGSCFSVRLTKACLLCYVKGGRDKTMEWWIWVIIAVMTIIIIIDWFIVMGADPRKWKGGGNE